MRAALLSILVLGGLGTPASADAMHCYCHGTDACAQLRNSGRCTATMFCRGGTCSCACRIPGGAVKLPSGATIKGQ